MAEKFKYILRRRQRRIKGDVQITTVINLTKIKTCETLSLFLKAKQPVLSFILMFNFCLTSFIVFVNYFIVLNSLMHVWEIHTHKENNFYMQVGTISSFRLKINYCVTDLVINWFLFSPKPIHYKIIVLYTSVFGKICTYSGRY